jgi:ABC-type multidrug transport system fused ATPase/permease subunit
VTALYLAVAFVSNWRLSLAFILFGAMSFALLRGLLSRAHQIGTEFNRSSLARAAKATEAVINMKLVKALGAERRIADEIAGLVESVSKFNARLETYPSAVRAIFEVVAVGLVCASLLAAVGGLVADVGTVLGVLFVFVRTYPRLSTIQQYFQSAAASLAFVPGIFRLMEDARRNREIEPASGNGRPAAETGRDVELRGVTVSYGDANAVENLDLSVATGEYVVIVGDSGSGKTTVLDCVLSLVQPTGGDVVVLGRSTSNTAPGVLRAQIGYIGQDTFLFNMSVRKNIAFPRDDVPDAMLENALSMAAASEFVAGLENGAETEIGDAGVRLSGGQRQRIGIARFFCDRKRLLLLDEATSALDVNTEDRILASLRALKGKSTIVFVTHRLSAARDADRVVVMDRGRIVEQGDWQSLTAAGGRFSAMWRRHADPVVAGP